MNSVFVFCVSLFFSLSLVLYCIYCMHVYDALLYGGNKESISSMKFLSLNFHHCSVVSLLALKRKMMKTTNPPALGVLFAALIVNCVGKIINRV